MQLLNDGQMSEWWFTSSQANDGKMLVNDDEMLVNDGEMLVDNGEMSLWSYTYFINIKKYFTIIS